MLPSWFDLIGMSKQPAHQGKEYEGRTLQGAELHLHVDRVGRRYDRTYATKRTLVMQRAAFLMQPCVQVKI